MNIGRVYECSICQIVSWGFSDDSDHICYQYMFVKKTLVYINQDGLFVDLGTNEIYKTGQSGCFVGELFINLKMGITPVAKIVDCNSNNMPKGKILSKYRSKNGDNSECK